MKSCKAVVGLGAACAACCAVPLLGLAGGLGAAGALVAACADELKVLAVGLLLLAAALGAAWWWRRQRGAKACGCAQVCAPAGPCGPNRP